MSSAGKRPKQKVQKTFFFCDRKRCGLGCTFPKCMHTQDPNHALSLEGKFKKNIVDGSMWQVGISVNGEIIDDSKRLIRPTL